ncbi:helix-turn-helix domain-containing protein [Chitinophaga parva]|nr:helix-turn-helix transcriptional regulator [Chitinophaga parva]
MKLSEVLKSARKEKGLRLRQVQETTGISNTYISQLENGKNNSPSAEVLYKLCLLYGLDVNSTFKIASEQ